MWSAVVVALAVVPWRNVEMLTEDVSDKTLHALAFVLGGLVWAGSVERDGKEARAAGFSLVICLLLGGLIEIVQGATSDRTAEFGDFVSDAIGAGIGILIWMALHRLSAKSDN
jgi:VanZ family protein